MSKNLSFFIDQRKSEMIFIVACKYLLISLVALAFWFWPLARQISAFATVQVVEYLHEKVTTTIF